MPKPPAFAKVFHEVRPDVFSVDPEFWHLVDGRCWAWVATSLDADRLVAGSTHVAAMLDGGVIAREVTAPDAWDEDALMPSATASGSSAIRRSGCSPTSPIWSSLPDWKTKSKSR